MLKSIIKSQQIIPKYKIGSVRSTVIIPIMKKIAKKSVLELMQLRVTRVYWYHVYTLEFTLDDGLSCKAGSSFEINRSHYFDKTKKITQVQTIINKHENLIMQINFFHNEERLVKVGAEDDYVKD